MEKRKVEVSYGRVESKEWKEKFISALATGIYQFLKKEKLLQVSGATNKKAKAILEQIKN